MARWLLLAHQLPARPTNVRVKTWRRLQQVGALPIRNSVYVLPNSEPCREDFEWIRSEIVSLGGAATVFAADALDEASDREVLAGFQHAREADYRALEREATRLLATERRRKRSTPGQRETRARAVRALRDRLSAVARIDYGQATNRDEAARTLEKLEGMTMTRKTTANEPANRLSTEAFRGKTWVTRPRPGVDRMSSAWLIRRFIDPDATFAFATSPGGDQIPFDMYEGEFSHHGSACTFETLVERFGIATPAVVRLGQIVHDLDMKESRYGLPEAVTVGQLVEGLRLLHVDDQTLLGQGIGMFEALARSFEANVTVPGSRGRRA